MAKLELVLSQPEDLRRLSTVLHSCGTQGAQTLRIQMPISCLSDGPGLRVVGLIDSKLSLVLIACGLSRCKVRVVRLGDWLNSGAILWISVFPCAV